MWKKPADIRKILVPVDLTEASLSAVRTAFTLTRGKRAAVYLIRVIPTLPPGHPDAPADQETEHWFEATEEYLRHHAQFRSKVTYILRSGDPAEEVLTFAREENVDVIVLPAGEAVTEADVRHPQPGATEDRFTRIARNGSIPVVVVRPGAEPFEGGALAKVLFVVAFAAAAFLLGALWMLPPGARAQGKDDCLTCHEGVEKEHRFHPSLAASLARGEEPPVGCRDCHGTHDPVTDAPPVIDRKSPADGCGECHSDVVEHFTSSAHGRAATEGVKGAPGCIGCHNLDITASTHAGDTTATKVAQEQLCLSCHLDNPDVRASTSPSAGFIAAFDQSVHGRALAAGNAGAPNCVDCHGSHEMAKGNEKSAMMNKMNVAATCSKCHGEVASVYNESAHGAAVRKGVEDAPTCTDCHGEHTILKHDDPNSPVAKQNLSAQVCSPCHSSVALTTKYGLRSDRFKTFTDSYHGLAIRGGSVEVANCASCHGSHNIRSSSDSASTISPANLAKTCGACHPGANERFGMGKVHVDEGSRAEEPLLYWIATAYIALIVVTIGGMLAHNVLDFVKKSRRTLMIRRGLLPAPHAGTTLYPRMNRNERFQHAALVVSFATLVVTGFMLRFPDAWWVQGIRSISDSVFDTRSLIHRIAGVLMVAASFWHLWYVAFTAPGRRFLADMVPTIQDARDAVAMVRYNLGRTGERPLFDRFSYIEKAEYWALIWGTFVMVTTGVVMWFDNTFIGLLTKLGYDVARTIHYYEAWIATLAIVVWHFYFVIFNPDVYPLNLAFWKGTLTEEEMEEDHPLELRRITAEMVKRDLAEGDDRPETSDRDAP